MPAKRLVLALAVSLVLGVTACAPEAAPVEGGPTVSAPAAAGSATDATPVPDVVAPPVAVPVVGDTISAADVEAVRATGAHVFVTPGGDGSGLVVQPGDPLPEAVIAAVEATSIPAPAQSLKEFGAQGLKIRALADEMNASGLSAFYMAYTGEFGVDGTPEAVNFVVSGYNVPGIQDFNKASGPRMKSTRAAAIATIQPLMDANPSIPLIDLTS